MPEHSVVHNVILASTPITGTTEAFSGSYTTSRFIEAVLLLTVTAAGGTSPTLTLKQQVIDDGNANWFTYSTDIVTTLDISSGSLKKAYALTNLGGVTRVSYTLGGGSPTATIKLELVLKD